jgi:hypothetical protein
VLQVFEEVSPLVRSCADGYNVCIFAYGQTGSGKTFTMDGPADNPGINTRALQVRCCCSMLCSGTLSGHMELPLLPPLIVLLLLLYGLSVLVCSMCQLSH